MTTDVIGLEMCGSLKNVTALAVGMARGAGYGENTAAMIETRGLAELTALGVAAGADPKTFFGLAGVAISSPPVALRCLVTIRSARISARD